jgi:hypothetical protein
MLLKYFFGFLLLCFTQAKAVDICEENKNSKYSSSVTATIKTIEDIPFPDKTDFAESFSVIQGFLYVPVNKESKGTTALYRMKLNSEKPVTEKFELIFEYPGVIVGSKIRELQENKGKKEEDAAFLFVGCDCKNQCVTVYDSSTPDILKTIRTGNYPNDICFDEKDEYKAYVASNRNFKSKNGIIQEINVNPKLTMKDSERIKTLLPNIPSCCGIDVFKDKLYIATLTQVIAMNLEKMRENKGETIHETIIKDDELCPYYDNIRSSQQDPNKLSIAMFSYNERFGYFVLNNYYLNAFIHYLASLTIGVGYFDIYQAGRTADYRQKIKFIEYDVEFSKFKMITLDRDIPDFDYVVTQILQLSDGSYLMANWKSNKLVRVVL